MKNFAMTGVGGFVAPRHLRAISDTGNRLWPRPIRTTRSACWTGSRSTSASSRRSSASTATSRSSNAATRGGTRAVVSICSPNYLHDAHIRLALRSGADAICEKPLVINPWNLDALQELEQETGRRVYTVLQLRFIRSLMALREQAARPKASKRQTSA